MHNAHEARSVRRRCRNPLELVEPLMLRRCSVGNKLRREELPERGILLPPSKLGELDHHLALFGRFCRAGPFEPAARVAAVKYEMRHALRMTNRIRDGNRSALRNAEKRKAFAAARVDDGLEIAHPGVERKRGIPVG